MNTELETAFIDSPPHGILPFGTKAQMLIRNAIQEANAPDNEAHMCGAYLLISKGNITPAKAEMLTAYAEADDKVVEDIVEYVNRVTEREQAAAIETESPGKS